MPTCFLKRSLPFALALVIGLMLVKFFGVSVGPAASVRTTHRLGVVVDGNGFPDATRVFTSREVDEKARIISRVEPRYTEEARMNEVEGTVVLRAVFSTSGKVTNLTLVRGLPYGLTESAVQAAGQIRFSPAMKDGRPVSQYVELEYNFNLY